MQCLERRRQTVMTMMVMKKARAAHRPAYTATFSSVRLVDTAHVINPHSYVIQQIRFFHTYYWSIYFTCRQTLLVIASRAIVDHVTTD